MLIAYIIYYLINLNATNKFRFYLVFILITAVDLVLQELSTAVLAYARRKTNLTNMLMFYKTKSPNITALRYGKKKR